MIEALRKILPGNQIEEAEPVIITGLTITEAAKRGLEIKLDDKILFNGYIYENVAGALLLFLIPEIKWNQGGKIPNPVMNVVRRIEDAQIPCWIYTRNSYFLFVDDWANIERLDMTVV